MCKLVSVLIQLPPSPASAASQVHVRQTSLALAENETGYQAIAMQEQRRYTASWDFVTSVALLYVAVAVPPQVAFANIQMYSPLWWIGSSVDMIFLIDLILRFTLPYAHQDAWITDSYTIARNYIRSWFFLDLVSIFPFEVFLPNAQTGGAASIRLVKLVRLLRLLKLGRMFRVSALMHRLEISMDIDYMKLRLCKYIMLFVIFNHWLACLLFLIASYSDVLSAQADKEDTWVDNFMDRWGDDLSTPMGRYIASIYFSAAIITRLGVGDIVPASMAEAPVLVSVLMGLVIPTACCGMYAYVIGGTFALLSAMHAENEAFVTELDHLNQFMRYRNLPQSLRIKLRDFLHFRWRERRLRGGDMTDLALTPTLATAVYQFTHIPLLQSLHPFRGVSQDFLITLSSRMCMCMFSSQDMIIRPGRPVPAMHILERGIVMKAARVLKSHAVVGMEMLVSEFPTWRGVVCLTNVMTMSISRGMYLGLVGEFPDTAQALRRNAIKDKVREGVIAYTDLVRRALPTLLEDGGDMLDIERIATPGQVQLLYDIRLNVQLADPSTRAPLHRAVRILQRMRRHHLVRRLVLANLERRAGYQPLAFIEDEHDAWTLSQCRARDLQSVYSIPMRLATAFLDDIRRGSESQGDMKPTVHASHRIVAAHVSNAVSLFLEIAHARKRERMKTTGELKRQLDHALIISRWAHRTCRAPHSRHII
eukprot:jgi/Ulvmu1/4396/UM002_0121.1